MPSRRNRSARRTRGGYAIAGLDQTVRSLQAVSTLPLVNQNVKAQIDSVRALPSVVGPLNSSYNGDIAKPNQIRPIMPAMPPSRRGGYRRRNTRRVHGGYVITGLTDAASRLSALGRLPSVNADTRMALNQLRSLSVDAIDRAYQGDLANPSSIRPIAMPSTAQQQGQPPRMPPSPTQQQGQPPRMPPSPTWQQGQPSRMPPSPTWQQALLARQQAALPNSAAPRKGGYRRRSTRRRM